MSSQYEVLSPWAEADPIPLRGISPRLADLEGKRIGLFISTKPAARPIMSILEQRLKDRYPTSEFSHFVHYWAREIDDSGDEAEFAEWVKGVDAVIAAIGD